MRRRFIIWATIIGAMIAMFCFRQPFLCGTGAWLDVGIVPQRADFVMALPGDNETRPYVAAALVRCSYADAVLLPKGATLPEVESGLQPKTHDIVKRILVKRGLSSDQIIILDLESHSTIDDGRALASFLQDKPNCVVNVVTSDYHTRRARWILQSILKIEPARIQMVSAPADGFAWNNWWHRRDGLVQYSSEYLKLGYYFFRYGNGIMYFLAMVGVAFAVAGWNRRRARHAANATK